MFKKSTFDHHAPTITVNVIWQFLLLFVMKVAPLGPSEMMWMPNYRVHIAEQSTAKKVQVD